MEAINNMASAATKAIWGENESKEEPISGVTGDTKMGEPYDAGNVEKPQKKANVMEATSASNTHNTPSTTSPPVTEDISRHHENIGKSVLEDESPEDPAPSDSAAGKTDMHHPVKSATGPAPNSQDDSTGPNNGPGIGPTNKGDNLGPGPKPLETLAKERGRNAGKGNGSTHSGEGSAMKNVEDGPQKMSHGEGTGEKYIQSTGLAADGGDFDATKPGAGREADRLLEEKNPAATAAKASTSSGSHHGSEERTQSPNDSNEKEKKSLGDKIKAKLHRH